MEEKRENSRSASRAVSVGAKPGWQQLSPLTLVDRAADAIIAGAAAGVVLPGDRIVEAEVARSLGISRVPVREALRVLESQGLVVNERYKGVRLMPVTPERLGQVLDVRVALEKTAVRTWLAQDKTAAALDRLSRCVEDMERVSHDSGRLQLRECRHGFPQGALPPVGQRCALRNVGAACATAHDHCGPIHSP